VVRRWALVAGAVLVGVVGLWFAVNQLVWASLTPHTGPMPAPPDGIASFRAEACEDCHPAQGEAWGRSRMAHAMTNPGFLADWHDQDDAPICLACHAPFQDQQAVVVSGLWAVVPSPVFRTSPHPGFDPDLQSEGVTCLACHLAPDGQVAVTRDVTAPHGTTVVDDLGEVCVGCHQMQVGPFDLLDRPLIDTAAEHRAWKEASGRSDTCADCHMTDGAHDVVGGWHADTVASGLRAELRPVAGGWELTITNEAGHHVPTGETSGAIELWAVRNEGEPILLERLTRVVEGPPWREVQDTTLRPTASRQWKLPHAERYFVVARMERLLHLPEARSAAEKAGFPVQEDVLLAESRLWAPGVGKPQGEGR